MKCNVNFVNCRNSQHHTLIDNLKCQGHITLHFGAKITDEHVNIAICAYDSTGETFFCFNLRYIVLPTKLFSTVLT